MTALLLSASNGHADTVEVLLAAGALIEGWERSPFPILTRPKKKTPL